MISEFAYYKKNDHHIKLQERLGQELHRPAFKSSNAQAGCLGGGAGDGVEVSNFIDTFFYQIIHRRFLEGGVRSRINRIGGGGGCIRLTWTSILSSKSTEKSGKWRNPKNSETTFSYSSNDNQPLYRSNAKFVTLLGFSCWCMKSKEVTNKHFKPLLL